MKSDGENSKCHGEMFKGRVRNTPERHSGEWCSRVTGGPGRGNRGCGRRGRHSTRDRFAGGEIAAMDGLVVFENIEEAELQKICTADFLELPCNFLGHRPIQYPREV